MSGYPSCLVKGRTSKTPGGHSSLAIWNSSCRKVTPLLVALSEKLSDPSKLSGLIERLEIQDPRIVQTMSVISLFEQQQERFPRPSCRFWFVLRRIALGRTVQCASSAQAFADLVAATLLLLAAPFIGLAAVLIWLEDHGPVFYSQQRSGWLGRRLRY